MKLRFVSQIVLSLAGLLEFLVAEFGDISDREYHILVAILFFIMLNGNIIAAEIAANCPEKAKPPENGDH